MDKEFLVGVEVNSKTINAGLVDLSGKIVKKISIPSEIEKGKKKVMENIALAVSKIKKNKVIGVGIAVPGVVNREKGTILESPFAGWDNFCLKKDLEPLVLCPVFVENEGKCFTLAEYKCGVFRKTENTIGILINDAISSGLILDGKLVKGSNFAVGDVSKVFVEKNKKLEDYASRSAIEKNFKSKSKKAKEIQEIIASEDEKHSRDVLKSAGTYFGKSMSQLVTLLNPELIVVGGPLAKSETFMSAAETVLNKSAGEDGKKTRLISSKLNDYAILGASGIVR